MTNTPGTSKGPLSRADQVDVYADAVAREAWSPLPPGSHVRVNGRHGPACVALQHHPGSTYVLTSSGQRMKLSKERQLWMGQALAQPLPASEKSVEAPPAPQREKLTAAPPVDQQEIDAAVGVFVKSVPGGAGRWHGRLIEEQMEANQLIERLARLAASVIGVDRSDDPAAQLDADRTALSLVEAMSAPTDEQAEQALTAVVPTTITDANAVALTLARMLAEELDEDAPTAIAAARQRLLQQELNTDKGEAS